MVDGGMVERVCGRWPAGGGLSAARACKTADGVQSAEAKEMNAMTTNYRVPVGHPVGGG